MSDTSFSSENQQDKSPFLLAQFSLPNPASWFEKAETHWQTTNIPWQSSPVDLSFLNADHIPAGKHGFLVAKGARLEFTDGTPARFWGVNIQARALFQTSDANIKQQAKRLSRLGFNLVRIHHHDSAWFSPNIFENPQYDTLTLNQRALKKLDWWIKCLKDEGIYIWMDLQVGREYTRNDGISYFDEVAKGKHSHLFKGFNYYNHSIQQKMMAFNQAYLSHVNPFTGLAYKDDPAIVTLLLMNENDLSHHFGNALLPNKNVPFHNRLYQNDIKQAAARLHLNPDKAWRSWEFGDSKIYLNDAEHRFYQIMLTHLVHLGVKIPIVTGNSWGRMSLAGLPSLTDGDMIDVHSYGREGELSLNPHYKAGFMSWIAAAQVSGKPLSVTEWNLEKFPVSDRYTIPGWLASIASLQGWDSLMLYGYSQVPLNSSGESRSYSAYNDPALMAMMPAAALLFRQHHVSAAVNHYHLRLAPETFFGQAINPETSASIRTLFEQSKISIDLPYAASLPWLAKYEKAMNASYISQSAIHHVIRNPDIDFLDREKSMVSSDTHEIKRDWDKEQVLIDTAKSQLVSGKIGFQSIALSDVQFNITTKRAVVAVQSLDNLPVSRSNNILISKAARCKPVDRGNVPFICEPVTGDVLIKAKPGLKVYQITSTAKKAALATRYTPNGYKIKLTADIKTPWLLLEKNENSIKNKRDSNDKQ